MKRAYRRRHGCVNDADSDSTVMRPDLPSSRRWKWVMSRALIGDAALMMPTPLVVKKLAVNAKLDLARRLCRS